MSTSATQRAVVAQARLQELVKASQIVVEQLDLSALLHRIVESARDLVGAGYGALGVFTPEGELERLYYVGLSREEAEAIGPLPTGHRGIVGALTEHQVPIRLRHVREDPRSVGVPAGHPAVDSFLGVPVSVRGAAYGNLYLINQTAGAFTAEDEELVTSLAAIAGSAIDNARLFTEARRRQAWAVASAEMTAMLLTADPEVDPLDRLAERVLAVSESDLICIVNVTPDPATLVVRAARGHRGVTFDDTHLPAADTLAGRVMHAGRPWLVSGPDRESRLTLPGGLTGPAIGVPLTEAGRCVGALTLSRRAGGSAFTSADVEMAADFAGRVSVAMQLAKARLDRQRMLLLEERDRIARDLHDHVIQQLFAADLELQGSLTQSDDAKRAHIQHSADVIETAISQIRTIIFALSDEKQGGHTTIRRLVIDIATELAPALPNMPQLEFAGPVDLVITGPLLNDVAAVIREGLTNVARHAHATHITVVLTAKDDSITAEISDNGRGFTPGSRRSGLANLEQRARRRGGSLTVEAGSSGTRLAWCVPAPAHPTERTR